MAAIDPLVEARLRAVADASQPAGAGCGATPADPRPPLLLPLYLAISEACAPLLAAGGAMRAGRPGAMVEALALSGVPWSRDERLQPATGALRPVAPPEASLCPGRDIFVLWVHAASVGESLSALPIVRALLRCDATARVLITTSTEAALRRLALEQLGPRVALRARPVDAPSVIRRLLRACRPAALVLVESELWPAMLREAADARIPTALINGRVSAASVRRWSQAPSLLATLQLLLRGFDVTLAQSAPMADVLRHLSGRPVACVGDLKQMRGAAPPLPAQLSALREALGDRPASEVWLAASTHEGEEEAALEAHAALRASHPRLLLVLAPRHTHRGSQVATLSCARGWHTERRCDVGGGGTSREAAGAPEARLDQL
jgi:3-deoxy-D-manno-octulosonic-acid transferase